MTLNKLFRILFYITTIMPAITIAGSLIVVINQLFANRIKIELIDFNKINLVNLFPDIFLDPIFWIVLWPILFGPILIIVSIFYSKKPTIVSFLGKWSIFIYLWATASYITWALKKIYNELYKPLALVDNDVIFSNSLISIKRVWTIPELLTLSELRIIGMGLRDLVPHLYTELVECIASCSNSWTELKPKLDLLLYKTIIRCMKTNVFINDEVAVSCSSNDSIQKYIAITLGVIAIVGGIIGVVWWLSGGGLPPDDTIHDRLDYLQSALNTVARDVYILRLDSEAARMYSVDLTEQIEELTSHSEYLTRMLRNLSGAFRVQQTFINRLNSRMFNVCRTIDFNSHIRRPPAIPPIE